MKYRDLLNFVFHCAIQDRLALIDAYGNREAPESLDAEKDIQKFKELRDIVLPLRGPASLHEWLESKGGELVTANPMTKEGREVIRRHSLSS